MTTPLYTPATIHPRPPCPACSNPLRCSLRTVEHDDGSRETFYMLYCAHGRSCPSDRAANDGAEGRTIEAALEKLTKRVEREEEAEA